MLFVGTSGWQYRHWRGTFYPPKLAQQHWLEHYAARFATAEVNNTFYNLPSASVFKHWGERAPEDFVFALKMSRFFTHLKRLRDPQAPVDLFLERAVELGRKRGPTLLQLPPSLRADPGLLDAALEAFPRGERVAVEFRHSSWFVPAVRSVLERRAAATCLVDRGGIRSPEWHTAGWGYVRFHSGRAHPPSCYGRTALETWARRLAAMYDRESDLFVYFNNDAYACAIRDAIVMAQLCAEHGLEPTRVPPGGDVTLGAA